MESETATRVCPLCSGAPATTRRTIDGWDLATCDTCGFLYAPVVRTNTATELEFPDDYEPVSRARHRQVHRLLASMLDPGEIIVDVGAGFGELGRVATEAGQLLYIGFEPSESVAAVARRRGVDMRTELFQPGSLDAPVGAAVLDNVIEHLEDPVGLLRTCVDAVRPGGYVVVIVPNRHDVRQLHPGWRRANHWIPPEHINYFTPKSARSVMEELGLEVHPFGFAALGDADRRYWPRAACERVGLFPFGLNYYGRVRRRR